ncbi:hypothetical protein SAMN05661080_03147 [Modestobacter sp. DSM 44400]|uniref:hypothetical protein n=1 Tax=Modestobacter sp. DSM 44400 TaxID=1550230 RepID=UPI000895A4FB|nr:hypothetical protein [Modestobacter sp. DSM 44400]SDY34478.1 hypothetical protein SAMN05661080_03147 [Modestobacter sp. DSM 44400]
MSGTWVGIRRIRVVIGGAGVVLALFGLFRLVTQVPGRSLLGLAAWLVGALVLHAVLSPAVVAIGTGLRKVPPRARAHLQGALVTGGLVTVIALPLIYRAGSQPGVKAILGQDYGHNLVLLLALISAVAVLSYLRRVVRGCRAAGAAPTTNDGPSPTA